MTDSYDDTCTEWYDANPSTCGDYDSETFTAADLCCACAGTGGEDAPVPEDPPAVVYDDCTNDDTLADSYDDTCTEWYDANPDTCGDYDTEDFIAADLCCACYGSGSGGYSGSYSYGNGTGYGTGYGSGTGYGYGSGSSSGSEAVVYDGCSNDDSLTDSYDDTCTEWYDANPSTCGDYDSETFTAADLCCACAGTGGEDAPVPEDPPAVVYDDCTNDDTLADSYDDTCTEWYDANPDTCGDYDTEDFIAADLCCACVGTGVAEPVDEPTPVEPTPEPTPAVVYDDCTNDDSVGDSYDDTCTEWYDANPSTCGDYDSETFTAADLCCACAGTGGEDAPVPEDPPAVVYDDCTNDDTLADSYDDTCTEWYDANPDTCGDYDTEDFIAADLCCACVGTGVAEPVDEPTPVEPTPEPTPAVVYDDCTNDDSVGDSYDDTCTEWYDANPDTCGDYDSETFTAADLCCACVGTGVTEPVVEPTPAPEAVVYEGCENDDSVGDSYDDTCTEWYDANPNTCGDYDTEDFIAADLCCACVGTGVAEPAAEPISAPIAPAAAAPPTGNTPADGEDEACCDCTCSGGGEAPVVVTCEDYQHLTEDGRGCTACQPTGRQILDINGNCLDCGDYTFLDGAVGNFFTKCTPSTCDLSTDIRYINGTCEACPAETYPNEDNTACVWTECVDREIKDGEGRCTPCADYTHVDDTGYVCIQDTCDNITEYLNINGSCKTCDAFKHSDAESLYRSCAADTCSNGQDYLEQWGYKKTCGAYTKPDNMDDCKAARTCVFDECNWNTQVLKEDGTC